MMKQLTVCLTNPGICSALAELFCIIIFQSSTPFIVVGDIVASFTGKQNER